jgi:hypothetical protein
LPPAVFLIARHRNNNPAPFINTAAILQHYKCACMTFAEGFIFIIHHLLASDVMREICPRMELAQKLQRQLLDRKIGSVCFAI